MQKYWCVILFLRKSKSYEAEERRGVVGETDTVVSEDRVQRFDRILNTKQKVEEVRAVEMRKETGKDRKHTSSGFWHAGVKEGGKLRHTGSAAVSKDYENRTHAEPTAFT